MERRCPVEMTNERSEREDRSEMELRYEDNRRDERRKCDDSSKNGSRWIDESK